ncbi:MAG: type II toxin-antitoxin system VapC family toxin [Bryobacteraceae bacterium]
MILADTSVWIGHLRKKNPSFAEELDVGQVLTHPFVIGELACGNLRNRERILADLLELPCVTLATPAEVLGLIRDYRLWGRGIGWVDVNLVASARLSRCDLWTLDTRLAEAARSAGVKVIESD